ncbi:DgyrCDS6890 [Dimorphilus gyrociliatus]|uniref:DgyrCDS6890 n=1 Tax=Dimorphilus gyrociliatus TaxID=2664684 RepID=A0A7I8VS13_9ANNE|nr:DgyrCDS6890 [Dimorphilus gyrociliatus]
MLTVRTVKRKYDDMGSNDNITFDFVDDRVDEIRKLLKDKTQDLIANSILDIEIKLCNELASLEYLHPVSFIYNPIDYAAELHCDFISKYGQNPKKVLFVGMNPGPFGMAQTGVPFGEVKTVKDWFKVEGKIGKPAKECVKRKISGLECQRSEVSGERFWSLFKKLCGTPDNFSKAAYVHNFCPLLFLKESGKNLTPVDLKIDLRKKVNSMCLKSLSEVIKVIEPKWIIGIGKYAKDNIDKACKLFDIENVKTAVVMHPSPANPQANKGWENIAIAQLSEIGVLNLFSTQS